MSYLLAGFRWRDAIDILLVSVVVYRVLVTFRGTRAAQMLIGVALIVAAAVLAGGLELHSLHWILENFWGFWVITLVVLFQPELRRALADIGRGRALRTLVGSSAEEAHVVEAIADAAETLSSRRIGALIILERTTGLRAYGELGVPLDAVVSPDLLVSLFLPYSPLHDGAVLIQGARIAAAGCFVPLSRNMHVGRALGTRHRAALGVTEETDAVVVIVSEETGRISLAVDGRLETPPELAALRRRLFELTGGAAEAATQTSFWSGLRRLLPRPTNQL